MITALLDQDPDAIPRLYGHLRSLLPTNRPPLELCMVASLDGSIAVEGRSGPLSGAEDRLVLSTLRMSAGMVLVGAGTVRSEGYLEPSPDGPIFAVVTARGQLDWDSAFARSPNIIIVTTDEADIPNGIETLRCGSTSIDLGRAVGQLGELVADGGFIHAEGGAQLNGALAAADLIDAVNLTIAARLVGGDAPRLTTGIAEVDLEFEITHLVVGKQHLFTRWHRPERAR